MRPISMVDYVRKKGRSESTSRQLGPFVTISRQYGCYGYSLALRLAEELNQVDAPGHCWQVYGKEGLAELAQQLHVSLEELEQQRKREPQWMDEVFRALFRGTAPSCWDLRRRVIRVIRDLASDGHAIIVGHGGSCATCDLPGGLSIRLEAPRPWRVERLARRMKIDPGEAARQVLAGEQEGDYLRKVYAASVPGSPAFALTFDCSAFTDEEIARNVSQLMQMKGLV